MPDELPGSHILKTELTRLLVVALQQVAPTLGDFAVDPTWVSLERTRDAAHGDFACNIAMRLAKPAKKKPREIAEAIIAALPASPLLARAEVAGAGFINLFLARDVFVQELARVHELGDGLTHRHPAESRELHELPFGWNRPILGPTFLERVTQAVTKLLIQRFRIGRIECS